MKKVLLAASLLFASFAGNASTDVLGDFIADLPSQQGLPLQSATVVAPKPVGNVPNYIADLDTISAKQLKVLEYSLRYGNKYDAKTGKLVEVEKTKRLGYHLAAIAWIESRACVDTGKDKKNHRAYGCWQVTTTSVTSRSDKLYPRRQVINQLETMRGGSHYAMQELEYWLTYHKGNIRKALASYNKGFRYKDPRAQQYAKMVMTTARLLEEKQIL
ncbi:lytic transglycosylase [Pantoea phage Phynn]|nr:lytic transglycosylase [Pantoea phage Phynn]